MFWLTSDILTPPPSINVGDFSIVIFRKIRYTKLYIVYNKSNVLTPVLFIQNIGDKIRGHGVSLCQMKESELN